MITEDRFIMDLQDLLRTDTNISLGTDILDIDEWDSFSAVAFIAMVDEKYGIKVDRFLVADAVIVEDLYVAVCSH